MSATVRWAQPADAGDLALVLRDMALHYRQSPLTKEASEEAARGWLATESPAFPHFALAYEDDAVAGLASVAIAHPGADLQRLFFLKDLYVRDGFRNAGVGVALLKFLAGHCLAEGIGRIDLTTEDSNEGAIRFYERLGADRHDQKIFLRFDTEGLRSLVERSEDGGR